MSFSTIIYKTNRNIRPPGKFFTMFHFLEYPFSRGSTHILSPDPYEAPDFDAGFMNDERDMAPMVWGYIKSRETARRMDAYAGEVQSMVPLPDPPYRTQTNTVTTASILRIQLPSSRQRHGPRNHQSLRLTRQPNSRNPTRLLVYAY